MTMIGIEEENI